MPAFVERLAAIPHQNLSLVAVRQMDEAITENAIATTTIKGHIGHRAVVDEGVAAVVFVRQLYGRHGDFDASHFPIPASRKIVRSAHHRRGE